MDVLARIQKIVDDCPVVIFMKGTPEAPQCGFSHRASQTLIACKGDFSYVNILSDAEIFHNLPRFANWPTFPQIYADGELIGGCDIVEEMHQNGELCGILNNATSKDKTTS